MNTLPRFTVVFPEIKRVSQYLAACRLVVSMMTGNANLPNPTPTLAQLSAHLDSLEAAEELARKGGKGAVQQRNVELSVVRREMWLLKAYVQSTAGANATESAAIIMSSGMGVGKKMTRKKPPFGAKHGKVSGRVVLEAKALPRPVQYRWQMSTDQKTWTDLPESFKSSTTVDGLIVATVYSFRLRTMTKDGTSDWGAVISILVH